MRYPGLPDDPSHQIATLQMKRFGGLIAVELEAPRLCMRWWSAVRCWSRRPASAASTPRWTPRPLGRSVSDGFARISLGIEDTDDLIADFEQALG